MTPVVHVQYDVKLSREIIVLDKASEGDIKDVTPTCNEQVTGKSQIWGLLAQMTSIGDVLKGIQKR